MRGRFNVPGSKFKVRCSVLGSRFKVRGLATVAAVSVGLGAGLLAQGPAQPDWKALEQETLGHFQSLVRIETMDPPGREELAADYVVQALKKEGIPTQTFTLETGRTNVVARLKGSGRRRPLLADGPPRHGQRRSGQVDVSAFQRRRDGGYIYGRGTIDDKDNVTASLMTMLLLKRLNVPLDRDVIFLAEAGEEGSDARRHPVHGRSALRRDRRGVLPRGRRRCHADERPGEVRVGADARKDSAARSS